MLKFNHTPVSNMFILCQKKKAKVPLRTFLTSFLFFLKSNSSLFIDNLLFTGALFHGSPAKVPKKGMISIYLLHFITYILFYFT